MPDITIKKLLRHKRCTLVVAIGLDEVDAAIHCPYHEEDLLVTTD